MKSELLQAIELALNGEWDQAHGIVQGHEEDATAAWIHAVLHKIEGDLSEQPLLVPARRQAGARGRRAALRTGANQG